MLKAWLLGLGERRCPKITAGGKKECFESATESAPRLPQRMDPSGHLSVLGTGPQVLCLFLGSPQTSPQTRAWDTLLKGQSCFSQGLTGLATAPGCSLCPESWWCDRSLAFTLPPRLNPSPIQCRTFHKTQPECCCYFSGIFQLSILSLPQTDI